MPMPVGHNIDSNIMRGVNRELDSIFSLPVNHLARFGPGFATIVRDALVERQYKQRLRCMLPASTLFFMDVLWRVVRV